MKPSKEIEINLLENESFFQNEFFDRFKLRYAQHPLLLTKTISKNYLFPTFYGDTVCAMAIFLCSFEKAAALMPHSTIRPISMLGGRSLVVISCYEYKQVFNIPPYNEIAFNIPVIIRPSWNVPVLPMIAGNLFSHFGYFCFAMPVTSLENKIRGEKIWGLPKSVNEVNFNHSEKNCQVSAFDEDGSAFLELNIPKGGKPTHFDTQATLFSIKNGELIGSRTHFNGHFKVIKNMSLLLGIGKTPAAPPIKLEVSPSARTLLDLEIDPRPFQFRFCPSMSACFDLPHVNYSPHSQIELNPTSNF